MKRGGKADATRGEMRKLRARKGRREDEYEEMGKGGGKGNEKKQTKCMFDGNEVKDEMEKKRCENGKVRGKERKGGKNKEVRMDRNREDKE